MVNLSAAALAQTTNLAAIPGLDPENILTTFGLAGLLLIIFAECGLLIGFFLPGDTLLFTAGILVSTGTLTAPLWLVVVLMVIAAVAGNVVGYWIGYKAGPAVFNKPDSKLFKREYVDKSAQFFEKYGPITVVVARFVPIVRTFATVMAGASRMPFRTYFTYSVIGGVLWAAGVTVLGYFLGQIPFIRDNVETILVLGVVAVFVVAVLPGVMKILHNRKTKRAAQDAATPPQPQNENTPTG